MRSEPQSVWPVIGDLVDSRLHPDRHALQTRLANVLARANDELSPVQPLELTVGDEFQGIFASLGAAVRATLILRLELAPAGADARFGIGCGTVAVFDASRSPVSQDGPGWWTARAAVDRAKLVASASRTSFVRTCYVPALDPETRIAQESPEVGAFLLCRDALLDQVKPRDRTLLLGLLRGKTQKELAAESGITQGAVSQALRRSAAFAIEAAQASMDEA